MTFQEASRRRDFAISSTILKDVLTGSVGLFWRQKAIAVKLSGKIRLEVCVLAVLPPSLDLKLRRKRSSLPPDWCNGFAERKRSGGRLETAWGDQRNLPSGEMALRFRSCGTIVSWMKLWSRFPQNQNILEDESFQQCRRNLSIKTWHKPLLRITVLLCGVPAGSAQARQLFN